MLHQIVKLEGLFTTNIITNYNASLEEKENWSTPRILGRLLFFHA
jgi:hypothetical protein